MKIWILGNRMTPDGVLTLQVPLACEVDTSESALHDLGSGFRCYVVTAPPPLPPTIVVVEASTGAVINRDLTAARRQLAEEIEPFSREDLEHFQETHRTARDVAFVCTDEQFWSFIAKLQELDQL